MIEVICNNDLSKISTKAAVVFSAGWCSSCHELLDHIEPLSETFDAKVYNVDVDENEELAEKYGIKSLPCTVLFKDGNEDVRFSNNAYINEILTAIRSM